MKLFNNTGNEVYYQVQSASAYNCGTIEAGGTTDVGYDNQSNVKVSFTATPVQQPPQVTPFTVVVPQTGTGKVVTIGLFQE